MEAADGHETPSSDTPTGTVSLPEKENEPLPDRDDDESAQHPEEAKGHQPANEEIVVEPAVTEEMAAPPPHTLPEPDADVGRAEESVEEEKKEADDETY